MSIESVRRFMAQHAPDIDIIETDGVTATVEQAAIVHNVEPNQIAKTLSLKVKNEVVLVVCAGEARLDNQKVKQALGSKARMLRADEVVELTSHPVGGVCPFGLPSELPVYCDISLQQYREVLPAAGSVNSALRISPQRMLELTKGAWIDICQ
ncbi:YbaK/EbsC family protein [Providencia stuartii]|uniref:YbaK/proline--tRNA ligase associated domain protein n=1 Tax=Providencia stuartii ATCC 25827 TaxID=471874 RepID=A0AA86YHT4_PROST|nr:MULTISPECIES: YbaK/EbsC family protein [Providencia]EDU58675.1 YbaK/proline--tRNA ligase associated domain protein [Providencia stuartii ATCC 25827]MBS7784252.1 YbaK/EbsC family protein [Providencia thailandensis]MDT2041848.1 YbaK/EbsC family protein [Providencia stuartii]MDT7048932.1 YbaK/EbsC family protein [Providencia stuartii]MTC13498.1 YbaK/EbsC family protein [Providencia stuartii]